MDSAELSKRAEQIRALERKNSRNVIDIGRILREVRGGLELIGFREWIKSEFRWSHVTAYWYMRVADLFDEHEDIAENFQSSAMIMLAKRATPKTAITECIRQAKSGKLISYSVAVAVIQDHAARQGVPVPHLTKPKRFDRIVENIRGILRRWGHSVCELGEHDKARVLGIMLEFCRNELGWEPSIQIPLGDTELLNKIHEYLEVHGAARGRVIAADLGIDEKHVYATLKSPEFRCSPNGYYSMAAADCR